MAFRRNEEDSAQKGGETYLDQVQDEVQQTGEGPQGESQELNRGAEDPNVGDVQPSSDNEQVQVNEQAIEEDKLGETFPEAHQVEPTYKIFVPFEDFEGRINQEDFSFKKDVPVRVSANEANTWLDAKKGYVK